jgi:hypothetical protein
MRARSILFPVVLVLAVEVSCFLRDACFERCDPIKNQLLYPSSFSVFGAFDGRVFTSGDSVLIVARFPASTCQLPEPGEAGEGCIPIMYIDLHQADGSNCLSIPAANSTKQIEIIHGIGFNSDPTLDTLTGKYNHWVFPFNVVVGMHTAKLNVIGLIIPEACSMRDRVTFYNADLMPKGNNLLTPNVSIDTLPSIILSVKLGKPAGTYTLGDVISVGVEFSKSVLFTPIPSKYGTSFMSANASYTIPVGLPYLQLNSQARALLVGYEAGISDRRKLSFLYNVGAGEFTPPDGQLDVPAGSTIQLNGGRIVALGTGIEADLTSMPLPGSFGEKQPAHQFSCLFAPFRIRFRCGVRAVTDTLCLRPRVAELAFRAEDPHHQDRGEVPAARL